MSLFSSYTSDLMALLWHSESWSDTVMNSDSKFSISLRLLGDFRFIGFTHFLSDFDWASFDPSDEYLTF